ncbi:MAG: hypothetical protein IPL35_04375 [Sphingobacteriales bacterium]|nr:hypothetical protein [Sphingobacteriales bacterium]
MQIFSKFSLNFSKQLFLLLCGFSIVLLLQSCGKDDCDGGCPSGYTCVNDKCVQDDPCTGITCDAGETCVNGSCVTSYETINKSGLLSASETWQSGKVYTLEGKVVVPDGITLTIQAGTIIKGKEGSGSLASALIVARGGKIMAQGTASQPIIFTSVLDEIVPGQNKGSNSTEDKKGLWGGVIILGKAPVSAAAGDTESQIEGIPADESYGTYGGSDTGDNSGVLQYVSIRHGGALIGEGNEINGLTLGGVGSGTTIDHIEVIGNLDDGIECFGGTVSLQHILVLGQGDDALDIDQNYSGTITNVLVYQGSDSDTALELDGPEGSTHKNGKFTISNSTFVGADGDNAKDKRGVLKSGTQGTLLNCLFTGSFDEALYIRASFNTADCSSKADAYSNLFTDNQLTVQNCQFNAVGINLADLVTAYTETSGCGSAVTAALQTQLDDYITSKSNTVSGTPTVGADKSVFNTWTWAAAANRLQ